MLARRSLRLLPSSSRNLSTSSPNASRRWTAHTGRAIALTGLLGGSALVYAVKSDPLHADARDKTKAKPAQTPLSSLIRSYVVYSACSIPTLIDWSPAILNSLFSIPGINLVAEALVRATFFSQFVGGDTAEAAIPLVDRLRQENKGSLFAYSVEVDEREAAGKAKTSTGMSSPAVYKRIVEEMIHSVDVAADYEDSMSVGMQSRAGRKTWVALKLTALLPDAEALIRLSSHILHTRSPLSRQIAFPGCPRPSDLNVLYDEDIPNDSQLSGSDIAVLRELSDNLVRICTRAKERGVRIIVDAEHSWYQPAIDAYALSLMRKFNKLPPKSNVKQILGTRTAMSSRDSESDSQPLVYGTFQAYLRRTYQHLLQSIDDAEAGNYALGVKLVRGAYHPLELAAHQSAHPGTSTLPGTVKAKASVKPKSLSISPDPLPPVHLTKDETDACYNECARLLIGRVRDDVNSAPPGTQVQRIGLLFGTHNWGSCALVLDELVKAGLAQREIEEQAGEDGVVWVSEAVAERVTLAQLFGMSDALTDSLVERTRCNVPLVMKYVPYGALSEVMPYLSRRAIENKSVMAGTNGAAAERKRAGSEIWKRIFG